MSLWIILDLSVLAVYIFSVVFFRKKGFLKASETVVSLVLTLCLMSSALPFFQKVIRESSFGKMIEDRVGEMILGEEKEKETLALPDFMQNSLQKQLKNIDEAKNNLATEAVNGTAEIIIKVISAVLLFILIKIGIFLLFGILELFFKMKLLNFVNRTMGVVLGLVNATVVVYVLCAAAAVFVPAEYSMAFKEAMDKSFIAGFFYNNNMIISLFL